MYSFFHIMTNLLEQNRCHGMVAERADAPMIWDVATRVLRAYLRCVPLNPVEWQFIADHKDESRSLDSVAVHLMDLSPKSLLESYR